jgi:hypothetical protein
VASSSNSITGGKTSHCILVSFNHHMCFLTPCWIRHREISSGHRMLTLVSNGVDFASSGTWIEFRMISEITC